jgi:SLT domain-containing protein
MLIMYGIAQALGALGGGDKVGIISHLATAFGFKGAKDGAYWSGGFQAFADGGVVTRPTMGMVGEGGQPEYVIPASKMRGAMNRYAAGARGSSVIPSGSDGAGGAAIGGGGPIDVRFTVERINQVDYVTADQFQRGMQQAAAQGAAQGEQRTLRRLQYFYRHP